MSFLWFLIALPVALRYVDAGIAKTAKNHKNDTAIRQGTKRLASLNSVVDTLLEQIVHGLKNEQT